jgi:hypothetical protein
MRSVPSILMGGVLPFGVVFVELFFILSSIWQHRFYYRESPADSASCLLSLHDARHS